MILAADVGGTKTVMCLAERCGEGVNMVFERRYEDERFQDFDELLSAFLRDSVQAIGGAPTIDFAVLGVAGPVAENSVRLTNRAWRIEAMALGAKFGIPEVRLINDFVAAAHGIPLLAREDLITLQAGKPIVGAPQLVLGAGTGFGVALRVRQNGGYQVLAGEGGNAGFAPANGEQAGLWHYIHARSGRVSIEQVVSGLGLATIYGFLLERGVASESPDLARRLEMNDPSPSIISFALERNDPLASRTLDLFVDAYGAVAGDQALTLLARGGVYVAGGIAPRIARAMQQGRFIAAFCAKGKFAELMAEMPVWIVVNERLGLLGATAIATLAYKAV
jgi:glucokinase